MSGCRVNNQEKKYGLSPDSIYEYNRQGFTKEKINKVRGRLDINCKLI